MREVITTSKAPVPAASYSQAIVAGGFCFVSGQVPIDPETGKLVEGDFQQQTRRVLENVKAILEAAGTSLENVVKVTAFLGDIGDFKAFNEVYGQYFKGGPPARTTVQAGRLPLNVGLEVDAIAIVAESKRARRR